MGAFFLCGQSFLSTWGLFSPCGGSLSPYVVGGGGGGAFWDLPPWGLGEGGCRLLSTFRLFLREPGGSNYFFEYIDI